MTTFKSPEIATVFGGIDTDALADGRVIPAGVLRELLRSGNLLLARGSQMFRWVGSRRQNPTELDPGSARHFVSPFWRPLIPLENWPVPKKPGLTKARIRIQATITNLAVVEVQIATVGNGGFEDNPDSSKTITLIGDGTSTAYGGNAEIRCRDGVDETVGFYVRAVLDHLNDPDLNDAVPPGFGGAASGVVTSDTTGIFWDTTLAPPWNLPPYSPANPAVHEGGHYVFFTHLDTAIPPRARLIHGPALIVNTWREAPRAGQGLHFWPPMDSAFFPSLGTTTYNLKQLPLMRMDGVAMYSIDREV